MKKRLIVLLCTVFLLTLLTACAKSVGGTYQLTKITGDGMSVSPSGLSIGMSFTLEEDGTGTASYNGGLQDIAWTQDGKTVTLSGPYGILELTQSGKDLTLYDEGTILTFALQEED